MAGIEGCYQQTKIRKDWRKETIDTYQGALRRVPRYVRLLVLLDDQVDSSPRRHMKLLTNSLHCLGFLEEFGIYLNYVRKLSFEETPDYDFLRDLFTKALKSMNEVEDGVYDWMLLNNGKGWESEADVSARPADITIFVFNSWSMDYGFYIVSAHQFNSCFLI